MASLINKRLLDFVSPADAAKLEQVMREERATTDRRNRQLQFRILTSRNQEKHVEARFRRLDGDGAPAAAGVLRDIEAPTWLADRLETERTRLGSIVESSGALVLLADRNLDIVMVNSEIVELTGVSLDAAVGRPMNEIVDWPLDANLFEDWRLGRRTEDDIQTAHLTCRHTDRTGRERILNVTAKPIPGRQRRGTPIRLSRCRRHGPSRRRAGPVRHRAPAVVGEMSAAVAHEIAQPLQIINLACHSALDELASHGDPATLDVAYIRQKLERIAGQIERTNRIVGELRAFVRGASADELHAFDPAEAVHSALDLTSHALQQARIRATLSLEGKGRTVVGHVGKLEQVLVNLINNARDSGGSNIDITLTAERSGSGTDQIRIAVQDNGPGIKPEVLNRLFNAFITTKPRGKGTGLGLRVCRRIVDEMRGTISGCNRRRRRRAVRDRSAGVGRSTVLTLGVGFEEILDRGETVLAQPHDDPPFVVWIFRALYQAVVFQGRNAAPRGGRRCSRGRRQAGNGCRLPREQAVVRSRSISQHGSEKSSEGKYLLLTLRTARRLSRVARLRSTGDFAAVGVGDSAGTAPFRI